MGSSLGLGPSTGFGFRFEVRVLTQEATHKLAGYFIFVHHVCVYARDSHCKFQLPFPPFQTDMPRTLSEGRRGSNNKKKKKTRIPCVYVLEQCAQDMPCLWFVSSSQLPPAPRLLSPAHGAYT